MVSRCPAYDEHEISKHIVAPHVVACMFSTGIAANEPQLRDGDQRYGAVAHNRKPTI